MGKQNLSYSKYYNSICDSMKLLSKNPKVLFIGQQVGFSNDFYGTLKDILISKRIEMPVAEEMQMGFCIGLALEGYLPVCIFQRMDFMYRAMDSLCNHLNLLPEYSRGLYKPKVIIRTTIGNDKPLNPGIQHTQDLTKVFQAALKFPVIKLTNYRIVEESYKKAIEIKESVLLIEDQKLYYDN